MLKCFTLFLLALFCRPLASQKNPSIIQLTWSREKKLKDIVAILALTFMSDDLICEWLDELTGCMNFTFFLLQKWYKIAMYPWISLFRLWFPLKRWWKERKRSGEEHFVAVILACRLFTSPSPWKQQAMKLSFLGPCSWGQKLSKWHSLCWKVEDALGVSILFFSWDAPKKLDQKLSPSYWVPTPPAKASIS